MKKIFKAVFLLGVVLAFTGCGLPFKMARTEILRYEVSQASYSEAVPSGVKIVISEFTDERNIWPEICNSFNTEGAVDDKWNPSKDVRDFIKEAITKELASEGMEVIQYGNPSATSDLPELQGKVRIFYGWYDKKSNFASAVNVDFFIVHKTYTIFYKSYLGENKTGSCGISLTQSTRNALKSAAKDIKEAIIEEVTYVKK